MFQLFLDPTSSIITSLKLTRRTGAGDVRGQSGLAEPPPPRPPDQFHNLHLPNSMGHTGKQSRRQTPGSDRRDMRKTIQPLLGLFFISHNAFKHALVCVHTHNTHTHTQRTQTHTCPLYDLVGQYSINPEPDRIKTHYLLCFWVIIKPSSLPHTQTRFLLSIKPTYPTNHRRAAQQEHFHTKNKVTNNKT